MKTADRTQWSHLWRVTAAGLLTVVLVGRPGSVDGVEPAGVREITLENVVEPGPNQPEEAIAKEFSAVRGIEFLDSAAVSWQKYRKCFTCHTNYAYLYARSEIGGEGVAHQTVRSYAEELVTHRWKKEGPRWDAEVIATAAVLAYNDRKTTGKLHPVTREALDKMWTLQTEEGGFNWLKCDWPPMESDDDYGVSVAALAVAAAPEDYFRNEAAQKGMAGIRRYLEKHPAPTVHHRAMLLWVGSLNQELGLLSAEQRKGSVEELLGLQLEDGGWSASSLGNWVREDGTPQQTKVSDGYGTGFVVFVLRKAGVPANDPRIERGVQWLKTHQRESGRWFARSLHKDSKHFLSHAGSAFAMMALAECGAMGDETAAK